MSYMLLIIEPVGQRETRTEAEGRQAYAVMRQFADELAAKGLLVSAESLASQKDGARVQVRSGKAQVVDGPFAEAKEMIGGFFLLSCRTRDEALAIAQACPAAQWATVEVRPLAPCYE
ncbi:MAG: YciI family protein [Aquabacterium sp.]